MIAFCHPTNSLTGLIAGRGRASKGIRESLLGTLSVCLKDLANVAEKKKKKLDLGLARDQGHHGTPSFLQHGQPRLSVDPDQIHARMPKCGA